MKNNYHKLLWQFNVGKYYDRYTMMLFITDLHGYNSMAVEMSKPFVDIKDKTDLVYYAKESGTEIKIENLIFALNVTPEKAVEYFKKLGITISTDWMEALQNCRQHSFTITKVMSMDILSDFKELLDKAITDGVSAADFKKEIKEKLATKGWLGRIISDVPGQEKIDSPWRLNLIYRQNTQTAYNQGRWSHAQETQKTFPYIQMISTIDKVTTDECRGLHLKVMRIDDKDISSFLPPGHYHCRRRFRALNESIAKKRGLSSVKSDSIKNLKNIKGFEFTGIGNYKPDLTKYPPEIVNESKKRA